MRDMGKFKHIRKVIDPGSEFTRNFLVMFRGSMIAQLIPITLTPVLTRIYTPAEFGVFELFLSVSLILGVVANARYELAVILPDKDKEAMNIMALGGLIAFCISLGLLLLVSLFADQVAELLNNSEVRFWLFFVPLVVFFHGLFNLLTYYYTRKKSFKNISNANVFRSSSRTGLQILIGAFTKSPAGLIIGQIAGFFTAAASLIGRFNLKEFRKNISWKEMKKQGKRYRDFPRFTMPATFANSLAVNLTSIVISALYNIVSVGFYSLANRTLGLPGNVIGQAMSKVYHKEAVDQRKNLGHAKPVFFNTLKKLLLVSLPVFLVLFLFSEEIFAFVFGEEWRMAGKYARILIPLIFIRFVAAPVSVSISVFEKQRISLYWQLGLLILSISVFGITMIASWDIMTFLLCFVSVLFAYYIFFIFILYRIVSGKL